MLILSAFARLSGDSVCQEQRLIFFFFFFFFFLFFKFFFLFFSSPFFIFKDSLCSFFCNPLTALKAPLATRRLFMSVYVSRDCYECPEIRFIPVKKKKKKNPHFQIIKKMATSCVSFFFFSFFLFFFTQKIAEIWHVRNVQGGRLTEGVEVG